MSKGTTIQVEGLDDMRKALRRAPKELKRRAKKEVHEPIGEAVAAWANKRMMGGDRQARAISRSKAIRGGGEQRSAIIKIGGSRPKIWQAAAGKEWGAHRPQYRKQFGGWVGNRYTNDKAVGHYVGRALEHHAADINEMWAEALERFLLEEWPVIPTRG